MARPSLAWISSALLVAWAAFGFSAVSLSVLRAEEPNYTGPATVEEAMTELKLPEFGFDQKSLEFAIRDLTEKVDEKLKGAPFKFEIKVMGKHLQLSGITRNQAVRDFKHVNATIGECLSALCKKAHPELVWVLGPADEGEKRTLVYLTTSPMAKEMKWTLPKEFE